MGSGVRDACPHRSLVCSPEPTSRAHEGFSVGSTVLGAPVLLVSTPQNLGPAKAALFFF